LVSSSLQITHLPVYLADFGFFFLTVGDFRDLKVAALALNSVVLPTAAVFLTVNFSSFFGSVAGVAVFTAVFASGFAVGFTAVFASGFAVGFTAAFASGFAIGFAAALGSGFAIGFAAALGSGFVAGFALVFGAAFAVAGALTLTGFSVALGSGLSFSVGLMPIIFWVAASNDFAAKGGFIDSEFFIRSISLSIFSVSQTGSLGCTLSIVAGSTLSIVAGLTLSAVGAGSCACAVGAGSCACSA
jgi:hypothetical protein